MSDRADVLAAALVGADLDPVATQLAARVREEGAPVAPLIDALTTAQPLAGARTRAWPVATALSVIVAGGAVARAAHVIDATTGVSTAGPWWLALLVAAAAAIWIMVRRRSSRAASGQHRACAGSLALGLLGRDLSADLAAACARFVYGLEAGALADEPADWITASASRPASGPQPREPVTMVGLGALAVVLLGLFWARYFVILDSGWTSTQAAPAAEAQTR